MIIICAHEHFVGAVIERSAHQAPIISVMRTCDAHEVGSLPWSSTTLRTPRVVSKFQKSTPGCGILGFGISGEGAGLEGEYPPT